MQKILKLTGVSMLAVMTASGAHAAGYTCEELIEYTSCNPGYYLQNQSCAGDNDEIMFDVCECDGEYHGAVSSKEECNIDEHCAGYGYATFYETACVSDGEWVSPLSGAVTCNECPAGSTCAGNTAGVTPCPAGSYCATAGLSQPTGKCAVGSFAGAGATACTSCPSTGLTDINGVVVNATTASAGSTSITACIVGSESQFKDNKGVYHYKSECAFDYATLTINNESECVATGGEWYADDGNEEYFCYLDNIVPETEEECVASGLEWVEMEMNSACGCQDGESVTVSPGRTGIYCDMRR
ncbi:MAG: hypothetical protein IKB10_01260 [Alphaproteobacteria bacterium]|nr:hypothetical protein [Alphaproteobacteria bacterium]MBR6598029.1 hypothetical protein [Alphaproteobacteria bacterium]